MKIVALACNSTAKPSIAALIAGADIYAAPNCNLRGKLNHRIATHARMVAAESDPSRRIICVSYSSDLAPWRSYRVAMRRQLLTSTLCLPVIVYHLGSRSASLRVMSPRYTAKERHNGQGREDRVRNRAYEIWEMEGCPNGLDREHWNKAIEELSDLAAAVARGPTAKSAVKKSRRLARVAKNPELRSPTQGRARDTKSSQAIVAH